MRFRASMFILVAILTAAACGGEETPTSTPSVSWSLEVAPDRPEFWSEMEIRVEVRANQPVLLRGVAVMVGDVRMRQITSDLVRLPVLVEEGNRRLAGTLMKDRVGAAARPAMPDRWDWAGEDAIVPVGHLAAGESAVFTTRWHATDPDRDFVRAVIHYLPVEKVGDLLVLDTDSVRTAAPPSGAPPVTRGWVPARRLSALYRPGAAPPADAHGPVLLGEIGGPSFLPVALPEEAYEKLKFRDRTERVEFHVAPPPLSLAEAREKVGLEHAYWTWVPPLSCYLLETEEASWLVGQDVERKCRGELLKLFAALGRGDDWPLELHPEDHGDEFGDMLSAFTAAGFPPEEKPMKGREPIHLITVRPEQALPLLDLLDANILQVNDNRIRPTR